MSSRPGRGFFINSSASVICSGLMHSSARRWPSFWLISIDLLPSCSHIAPRFGSSRRMAPVRLSTGCMLKRNPLVCTTKKPGRLVLAVSVTELPSSQAILPTKTRLAISISSGVSLMFGSSSIGVTSSTAFRAERLTSAGDLAGFFTVFLAGSLVAVVDWASNTVGKAKTQMARIKDFMNFLKVKLRFWWQVATRLVRTL